jgi:hypothetical protein
LVSEAVRKGTDRPDPLSLLAGNSMTIRYWQNVCYIQCAVSGNRIATPSLTVCAEWPPTPILPRKTLWHIGLLVGKLAATWPPTFPRPTKLTPFRTASQFRVTLPERRGMGLV